MDVAATAAEFLRGGLAGLAVCVPPGPMSTLCVTRSVRHGFGAGFAMAAGAAAGDAVYAGLAALGMASFQGHLGAVPRGLAFVASPLLLWMGFRSVARARAAFAAIRGGANPAAVAADEPPGTPLQAAAAGCVMALGTPATLPAFVALFAALGGAPDATLVPLGPAALVAGALTGTLLWWAGITVIACRVRGSAVRYLHVIDAAGGALLFAAAALAMHVAISGAGLPSR